MDLLEHYNDQKTKFLSKFFSGKIEELKPHYDPTRGYCYPEVKAILGNVTNEKAFLDKLYEAGILERKVYDKNIHCPSCGSQSISIHHSCPFCKSIDIQRRALIEHIKCGYMDVEENFKKGSTLFCPKCHEGLNKLDVDHRKAGLWCICRNCSKSFDIPLVKHFCKNCKTNFTFEDAAIEDVYSYSLKNTLKETAKSWEIISSINEFLYKNEFEVKSPAALRGQSGTNHSFDIVAYRKKGRQKIIVIDVSSSRENEVSEQSVITLFAKIFDVSPDKAFLIAIPKMTPNGKKMAELYNIRVMEGKNQKEVITMLEKLVKSTTRKQILR